MSSAHSVLGVVNEVLNDAERSGFVTKNVARLVNHPSLDPAELARFLEAIERWPNEPVPWPRAPACAGASSSPPFERHRPPRRRLTVSQAVTVVDHVEVASVPKTPLRRRVLDLGSVTIATLQ